MSNTLPVQESTDAKKKNATGKAPAFQFYPSDFLADAAVSMMTPQQVGAYLLLLCHDWNGDGLPNEVEDLAILAKTPMGEFLPSWEKRISRCFVPHPEKPNHLTNPRLEKERLKQKLFSAKRVAAANTRWDEERRRLEAANNGQPDAHAMHEQSKSNPRGMPFSLQSSSSHSGGEEIAPTSGAVRRPTGKKAAAAGVKKATWISPVCDTYMRIRGKDVEVPVSQMVKTFKPLVDRHGADRVCTELEAYLTTTPTQFQSWPKFGAGFGSWVEQGEVAGMTAQERREYQAYKAATSEGN